MGVLFRDDGCSGSHASRVLFVHEGELGAGEEGRRGGRGSRIEPSLGRSPPASSGIFQFRRLCGVVEPRACVGWYFVCPLPPMFAASQVWNGTEPASWAGMRPKGLTELQRAYNAQYKHIKSVYISL